MSISPARIAAFDILRRIESERAFSCMLLPAAEAELGAQDRGLCHELVLGTLRRQMLLDRQIEVFSNGKKLDVEVRTALRLGLYQLRYLDKIPAYSAINDSVDLTGRAGKASAKGVVNAILRRATREIPIIKFQDDLDRVSVETSHPRWLVEKWTRDHGAAVAAAIAAANNELPASAYRSISGNDEEVLALVKDSRPSEFVPGVFIAERRDNRLSQLSAAGKIYLQDEASQMVASAIEVPTNGTFLDVCASPGGKTGIVSMRNTTATIIAGDLHWPRVEFLRENCRRQGVSEPKVVQYDAERDLPFNNDVFDSILVDAPCSGTGTIRHNPEIRYFLKASDLEELNRKQLSIISNASKLVKRGGLLLYSTCSIEREENEEVCRTFLANESEFVLSQPNIPSRFLTNDGFARTWPHRDGMDGFFVAALRRR